MQQLNEKQRQRVDGVIHHINDFLDKRFAQARRINARLASAEADLRFHQVQTLRTTLEEFKGFGFGRLMVGDILCSADEAKKRDLFNPSNQSSIMREIVPAEQDSHDKRSDKLEIDEVKAVYKAIDPLLEKVVVLVQCWIWWDLRDAADLYRFEAQTQRLEMLRHRDIDQPLMEHYHREMNVKPEEPISKEQVLVFELVRLREIVERYETRRREEPGYQVVVASREMEGGAEADATCVRLARRLMLVDKLRSQQTPPDEAARAFYAPHLGVPADHVTAAAVIDFEQKQSRVERQLLADQLGSGRMVTEYLNYKVVKLEEMKVQLDSTIESFGIQLPAPVATHATPTPAAQPAAGE